MEKVVIEDMIVWQQQMKTWIGWKWHTYCQKFLETLGPPFCTFTFTSKFLIAFLSLHTREKYFSLHILRMSRPQIIPCEAQTPTLMRHNPGEGLWSTCKLLQPLELAFNPFHLGNVDVSTSTSIIRTQGFEYLQILAFVVIVTTLVTESYSMITLNSLISLIMAS